MSFKSIFISLTVLFSFFSPVIADESLSNKTDLRELFQNNNAIIYAVNLRTFNANDINGNDIIEDSMIQQYDQQFLESINDDLNMPQAMSVVWDVVRYPKKSKQFAELLLKFDRVLGLEIDQDEETELPKEIIKIIEERKKARDNKDWSLSDKLRDELISLGYTVKDTKDGMEVSLKR